MSLFSKYISDLLINLYTIATTTHLYDQNSSNIKQFLSSSNIRIYNKFCYQEVQIWKIYLLRS